MNSTHACVSLGATFWDGRGANAKDLQTTLALRGKLTGSAGSVLVSDSPLECGKRLLIEASS